MFIKVFKVIQNCTKYLKIVQNCSKTLQNFKTVKNLQLKFILKTFNGSEQRKK